MYVCMYVFKKYNRVVTAKAAVFSLSLSLSFLASFPRRQTAKQPRKYGQCRNAQVYSHCFYCIVTREAFFSPCRKLGQDGAIAAAAATTITARHRACLRNIVQDVVLKACFDSLMLAVVTNSEFQHRSLSVRAIEDQMAFDYVLKSKERQIVTHTHTHTHMNIRRRREAEGKEESLAERLIPFQLLMSTTDKPQLNQLLAAFQAGAGAFAGQKRKKEREWEVDWEVARAQCIEATYA